jgi:putative integral membrane protein (TIGR02587 family)
MCHMDRATTGDHHLPPSGQTGENAPVSGWTDELNGLVRGLTGGFLVGIPLIYTMETWWVGETISMPHALLFLALAYALNFAFVAYAGFREGEAGSHRPFGDALEATALAVVATTVTLALLNQLDPSLPLDVLIGRIAVDALPVSLGVAIANHILAPRETRVTGSDDGGEIRGHGDSVALDVGAAFAGSLFLSLNIAPTEEVPMLATGVPTLLLPLVILFSLLASYAVVFAAGFGGQERRLRTPGAFQRPITETVVAYVTSLVTGAGVLWLFGQIDTGTAPYVAYAQIVLLGLPAAIGGAAGRRAV